MCLTVDLLICSPQKVTGRIGISLAHKIGLWHMHRMQYESLKPYYLYAEPELLESVKRQTVFKVVNQTNTKKLDF